MSINSNMKAMTLQIKEKVPSKSGAPKYDWLTAFTIGLLPQITLISETIPSKI